MDELKNVKITMRSIVISNPRPMDIPTLERDYLRIRGSAIPAETFGYPDVLTFLKKGCTECFAFDGDPQNPTLIPIIPITMRHIDRYVLTQVNSRLKIDVFRKSILEGVDTTNDMDLVPLETLRTRMLTVISSQAAGFKVHDLFLQYRMDLGCELRQLYRRFKVDDMISFMRNVIPDFMAYRQDPFGDWIINSVRCDDEYYEEIETPAAKLPDNCLQFGDGIPMLGTTGLEVGQVIDVQVSELFTPSYFWLKRLGKDYDDVIIKINKEMTDFYTKEGAKLRFQADTCRVGQYCACPYSGEGWFRGLIIRRVGEASLLVRYVDTGIADLILEKEVKPLLRHWATAPTQGIRGRLPDVNSAELSKEAMNSFINYVFRKPLIAKILAVDHEAVALDLTLTEKLKTGDIVINDVLRNGESLGMPNRAVAIHVIQPPPLHPDLEERAAHIMRFRPF